ncbi:MAG: hypothetical protein HOH33_15580 [Verrucomicrobia bacterium]|jgi:hypothetical protein|nr:hypothetical protein [Verrucomicrobiota bacterium]
MDNPFLTSYGPVDVDSDGDGDNADVFPNDPSESADADGAGDNADQNDASDISLTVIINGSDNGVENTIGADGVTLADLINTASAECANGVLNHG